MYLRWKISYNPHAAGTDRGDPRDAGEVYACQVHIWLSNITKIVVLKSTLADAFICYCFLFRISRYMPFFLLQTSYLLLL